MESRYAAIVAADVVGFGRLVQLDEVGTISALKAHIDVLQQTINLQGGRIFKSTGDGFLAEFPTALAAVGCANFLQQVMADRNANGDPARRMDFRMGVHAGDILVDEQDLLGDAVNLAARLEAVARPGGVALSDQVHTEVEEHADLDFSDLGEQELKNVARPVRVYALGQAAAVQTPALVRPQKPSVAVLPFENLSQDEDDGYFADGVTDDIINALTYVPWIFVIARNSTFSYKGLRADVRRVGRELGVRYILQGSVRRSGSRIRVTGQLTDSVSGANIWADRFDGGTEDIFDLQDQVTDSVVRAIAPEIKSAEIKRVLRKRPDSLNAYDMYLRGQNALHLGNLDEADQWLIKSTEIAPDYAKALALRGWISTAGSLFGRNLTPEIQKAGHAAAKRALELEPDDCEVSAYAGYAHGFHMADPTVGLRYVEEATEACPSFAWAWASSCMLCTFLARADDAIERADQALRLSPKDPMMFRIHISKALAYLVKDDFDRMMECADIGLSLNPNAAFIFLRYKAMAFAEMGDMDHAKAACDKAMQLVPDFDVWSFAQHATENIGVSPVLRDKYVSALLQSGFPETRADRANPR
ncbi:MAG: adenylate/guanylate cyclase domain-containing protein [Pseudomonadota bacterium]